MVQLERILLLNLKSSKIIHKSQPGMVCCTSKDMQYNVFLKFVVSINKTKIGGGSWVGSKWSISTSRGLMWPPRGRWSSSSCSETSKYCHQALFCCVFQDLIENTPKSITSSAVTLVPRPNNFFHLNKGTWNRKQLNKGTWNNKTIISMTNSFELGLMWE